MNANKPVIAVVGASGLQGGAVVDSLLRNGKFAVRAVLRKPDSDVARELATRGVDIKHGDFDDISSLIQAFMGCHGVFINTDTLELKRNASWELQQGKNASDAAKKAAVQHLIYSSLEDPSPGFSSNMPKTEEGYVLPVFQVKAEIEEYIRKQGPPATFLITSAYYENYHRFFRYLRQPDGSYLLATNVGTKPYAQNAVADIGASAAEVFEQGQALVGKAVPVVSQLLSMDEAVATISEVTGRKVIFSTVSDEHIRGLPQPFQAQRANLYQYFRQSSVYEDCRLPSAAVVEGTPFRQWAAANKERLLARLDEAVTAEDDYAPFP